jgi:NADPH:quinone reductase-like Zn-dependent oxidoreductase
LVYQGGGWGSTRVELGSGSDSLHLEGSGKAALGWDFVIAGVQEFAAGERLVATLAPDANRMTLALGGPFGLDAHVLVYDDSLTLRFESTVIPGDTRTFDIPWPGTSTATMVIETAGGAGTYSVAWSASVAPVPQNSFLLPVTLDTLLIIGAAGGIGLAFAIWHIRKRPRLRRPL